MLVSMSFIACLTTQDVDVGASPISKGVDSRDLSEMRPTAIWLPAPGTSWQWQLESLPIDESFDVEVYDIDLFENDEATVARLHSEGRRVVCYLSAGTWEEWRPDAAAFPRQVIGKEYAGWPGEKWLDIRRIDELAPVLRGRLDLCKAKGFDGVEPDNIDGYMNETGFPLSEADQLTFNRWLAEEAHERGLSIGLKNDPDQAADLLEHFDWALTEDCFADDWCDQMRLFTETGKAVFAAEYSDTGIRLEEICPGATQMRFSVILKNRNLDAARDTC